MKKTYNKRKLLDFIVYAVEWNALEISNYITLRRACSQVRRAQPSELRLKFEEVAILAHLKLVGEPIKTSDIADYQGALRPTTTHRMNRLTKMGFVERKSGEVDRRNIVCSITEKGEEFLRYAAEQVCAQLASGNLLTRVTPERVYRYIDAMGVNFFSASDLILVSLREVNRSVGASELVAGLDMLQPTVFMALSSLRKVGLISRKAEDSRTVEYSLTDAGLKRAEEVAQAISKIVIRRN